MPITIQDAIKSAAAALGPLTEAPGEDMGPWLERLAALAYFEVERLMGLLEATDGAVDPSHPALRAAGVCAGLNRVALALLGEGGDDPRLALHRDDALALLVTLGATLEDMAAEAADPTPVVEAPDRLTCHDVPLANGKTLRVGMDVDGSLILAVGDGKGDGWLETKGEGATLPPGTLPALLVALRRLAG